MTQTELTETVETLLDDVHNGRIFAVEDGTVWVSGMNQNCKTVAERMAKTLVKHDIPTGLVHDDGIEAIDNGGVRFEFGPQQAK